MIVWTVRGEAGKTLDDTERTIAAVGMQAAVLELQSLDVDTLTWVQVNGIIPDDRQLISLYRDGERVFHGRITQRQYVWQQGGGSGYSLTASGALYEMANATITDDSTDGTGATATRPSIQFAPGDLRDMVIRLLEKAPGIEVGHIDPMFNVGRQTFTGGTWLAVLVELLKPVADVAAEVDYSSGSPRLNIVRRPYMETIRVTLGIDAVSRVELAPKTSLKVTGITLATASRDATGKIVYGAQTAGDGSQIVPVSGPEIGAFTPPDDLPSVQVQTTDALTADQVAALDSTLASLKNEFGTLPGGISNQLNRYTGSSSSKVFSPIPFPSQAIKKEDGTYTTFPSKKYVISGSLPDWAMDQLGGVRVTVTGNWLSWRTDGDYSGTVFEAMIEAGSGGHAGYYNNTPGDTTPIYYAAIPFSVQLTLIDASYADLTTVYQAAAYEYLTAPVGMAEGMFQAANFVPWEGTVALTPKFQWRRFLGRKLNVYNADPDMRFAGALIQGMTVNLTTGEITLKCGAPQRVSLDSAVSRYQPSAKDNIVLV